MNRTGTFVNSTHSLSSADLHRFLEESGAIMKGHFVLSSGRHSDVYVEKFRILEQPAVLEQACQTLLGQIDPDSYDVIAGPTTGGIIVAFEAARIANKRALYVESVDGVKTVKRSARLEPGERVLVLDDVLTTGLSLRETVAAVQEFGGNVSAAGVLIDRTERPISLDVPVYSALRVEATSYLPHEVPDWLKQIPTQQPGSRKR